MSSQFSWTVDRLFGCWLWSGHTDKRDGRAIVWRGKSPVSAQRAVYEEHIGPVGYAPDGEAYELDHLCRRAGCVAPHHAEPVTRAENERRKSWRHRAKRMKCPRGHELSVNGVVTPEGGRVCRQCNREAMGERT